VESEVESDFIQETTMPSTIIFYCESETKGRVCPNNIAFDIAFNVRRTNVGGTIYNVKCYELVGVENSLQILYGITRVPTSQQLIITSREPRYHLAWAFAILLLLWLLY
jgi:hypothetical protein